MDSITQGLLGAAAAQAVLQGRLGRRTWLIGALGGMAADLDIFIRSFSDPMVGWTYHRHFTHSLFFIPIGGAVVALPFVLRTQDRARRRLLLAAATIGYATHAVLDALTSYGTLLFWPISDQRVALDWVAIVDPLYSAMLAVGIVLAARRGRTRPALIALLLSTMYLGLGGVQHARARAAAQALAAERGHQPSRLDALPSPAFHLLWRTLYESDGRLWIDGVRTGWTSGAKVYEGGSVARVTVDEAPDDPASRAALAKFLWFARGWVGRAPSDPEFIGDMRFGGGLTDLEPGWGLRFRSGATPPYEGGMRSRDFGGALGRQIELLRGD